MSVWIWARKTVALGLAATLVGPGVSLLSAQENDNQAERRARRQKQEEGQQRKQAEREQQQAERRAQREDKASRQAEREQQDQQQRQRDREQRSNQQQERQQEMQRQRQEQRQAQEERQRDRMQRVDQDRAARQAEQAQRQAEQAERRRQDEQDQRGQFERSQRRQAEQAEQRRQDLERGRERRAEEARQAEAQARANAESARRAQENDSRNRQYDRDGRTYRGDRAVSREGRISESRRNEIIRENRDRTERSYERWNDRQRIARERSSDLQRHRRYAQYRYQQRYQERLRNQWRYDWNRYDYDRDPYFWSAPDYRYRYRGSYYEINDYGADLLREAVNRGYEEGFYAGEADREDRWRGDYRDSYVYEDASYGYRGLYVDEEQYAYYFRQGFDRGYADGYNRRYQYGRRDGDGLKILAGVLAGILVFEALR